jgi:hypothetical protein
MTHIPTMTHTRRQRLSGKAWIWTNIVCWLLLIGVIYGASVIIGIIESNNAARLKLYDKSCTSRGMTFNRDTWVCIDGKVYARDNNFGD